MAEAVPFNGATREGDSICSSLTAASMPWVFTQHRPLDTGSFIREAKRRGFELDLTALHDLYRYRLLVPFVYVGSRQVANMVNLGDLDLSRDNQHLIELRTGRNKGHLVDLASVPNKPWIKFEEPKRAPRQWWNGLIYSQHQLLALPELKDWLSTRYRYTTWRKIIVRERVQPVRPDASLKQEVNRFRRIAIAATALEARYLPTIDPEWVQLKSAKPEEWKLYRSQFDPVAMSVALGYTAEQARQDAEHLLFLAYRSEPVGSSWSQLIRRSPRDSWKDLKDAALSAMDFREAAEILLCFYDDLAGRDVVESLPEIDPRLGWHPLHERLSFRRDTLDQNLMHLKISPHPRVVLAVEGDSEEVHAPKVWQALEYPDAPELIRVLNLGGTDRDMQKVAALAAAPLVGRKESGREFWWLIKPPTCFMVAADPENQFHPARINGTRSLMLDEIRSVLKAQGVKASDSELEKLVEIRTWTQSCYEFAHFTDEELADGIIEVHSTCNGWSRDQLIASLAHWRGDGKDIKRVWKSGGWDSTLNKPTGKWDSEVSKTKLAVALWPVLEQKIQRAKIDETVPLPEIVEVMQLAYHTAQNWRYKSFVLTAAD
jgi:hypothetical protein